MNFDGQVQLDYDLKNIVISIFASIFLLKLILLDDENVLIMLKIYKSLSEINKKKEQDHHKYDFNNLRNLPHN